MFFFSLLAFHWYQYNQSLFQTLSFVKLSRYLCLKVLIQEIFLLRYNVLSQLLMLEKVMRERLIFDNVREEIRKNENILQKKRAHNLFPKRVKLSRLGNFLFC